MNEVQPNESDWLKVGNDLRVVLNDLHETIYGNRPYKMEKVGRCPTQTELDEWELRCPGSVAKLQEMACRQAAHRVKLEKFRKTSEKFFVFSVKLFTVLYSTMV